MSETKPAKKPFKKSTSAVVETRVAEVAELMIAGSRRSEIIRYCARWDISERQVDNYIKKARDVLAQISRELVESAHGLAAARLERIYRKAMARAFAAGVTPDVERDFLKLGLDTIKEHNRLHGLAGERRILEGDPTRPVYITPGQLPESEWSAKYSGGEPKPAQLPRGADGADDTAPD
jgi:hypothetical protein